MTRKDYALIADIIAAIPDHAASLRTQKADIARAFAEALGKTNPLFDRFRFLKACDIPLECGVEV